MSFQVLRIAHLGKYYPPAPGGIEAHVQTLAQAQARLGHRVQILCVNHADPRHTASTVHFHRSETVVDHDGAVEVHRLGRSASLGGLDICRGLRRSIRLMSRDADVLHLHTPNPTMLLALAGLRLKVPLVIMHHSDIVRQRVLKHGLRPFENLVYGKAARILCTNPLSRAASSLLARHDQRVECVPLGIDLEPYVHPSAAADAFARELRAKYGSPLWLAVGRLVYYKGLHVAIRALHHAPGTLLVIGAGPLKASLQQLSQEQGVADRVIWLGHVTADELAGAYHAATAFWFPSTARSEAFGLVQVEAMASGCPVINTDIPGSGVPWVSPHEQTGLTVPVEDAPAFASAALRLINEAGLRERLAAAGPIRASQEFSAAIMAQRTLEIYGKALGQPAIMDTGRAGQTAAAR